MKNYIAETIHIDIEIEGEQVDSPAFRQAVYIFEVSATVYFKELKPAGLSSDPVYTFKVTTHEESATIQRYEVDQDGEEHCGEDIDVAEVPDYVFKAFIDELIGTNFIKLWERRQ